MPPTFPPITGVPFHIASVTVRPKPSRIDFLHDGRGSRLQGIDERAVVAVRQHQDALIAAPEKCLVDRGAFGIVRGKIAEQHQRRIDLPACLFEGLDHALRILPGVEPGDLHDEWQIGRNVVMGEPLVHLGIAQLPVLDRKRVDRRHEEDLRWRETLCILAATKNRCVIFFDEPGQIVPESRVRPGQLDVAAPNPGILFLIVLDQRKRLRIVDDDIIVIEVVPNRILMDHAFVDLQFEVREVDIAALQCIVHFLGDIEEVRRALDHSPFSFDP